MDCGFPDRSVVNANGEAGRSRPPAANHDSLSIQKLQFGFSMKNVWTVAGYCEFHFSNRHYCIQNAPAPSVLARDMKLVFQWCPANTERTRGKLHRSLTSLRPQAAKCRVLLAMFANMPRQLCELKLAIALLKNHATALCVGSFTNTLNTLCCPKCRF